MLAEINSAMITNKATPTDKHLRTDSSCSYQRKRVEGHARRVVGVHFYASGQVHLKKITNRSSLFSPTSRSMSLT